jgi:sarcosine oxidase subunit beta
MSETADVIIVGAGVQGASLAFHLAGRGQRVIVLERSAVAAGATGRSSGFVRMHYDLASESYLAWASYPYFRDWQERVGAGDCSFVNTGFIQLVPPELSANLRANVANQQALGVGTQLISPVDVARIVPGAIVDDIEVAAWEPGSGYADPSGTAAGFLAAARKLGARVLTGCEVRRLVVAGSRVTGVETSKGTFEAPAVVLVNGVWATPLARTVGLDLPVEAWRHDTAYFGLPDGHGPSFPVVIDEGNGVYWRPEGSELMLVGLHAGNEFGGDPDRPMLAMPDEATIDMITRVCARLPWMEQGTLRTAHGGQDGITPDQHPIIGPAGPDGLWLSVAYSGTGFKTAPAIGCALSEWMLDGAPRLADLTIYDLGRFARGALIEGEHPYGHLWR